MQGFACTSFSMATATMRMLASLATLRDDQSLKRHVKPMLHTVVNLMPTGHVHHVTNAVHGIYYRPPLKALDSCKRHIPCDLDVTWPRTCVTVWHTEHCTLFAPLGYDRSTRHPLHTICEVSVPAVGGAGVMCVQREHLTLEAP